MPGIHSFVSDSGTQFMQALSSSENMKLFETTAVKKLIEF